MSGLPINTGSSLHAIKLTEAVINTCWQMGDELRAAVQVAIANAGASFIDPDNPPEMIAPVLDPTTVDEPSVIIPADVDVADVFASFDSEQMALVADLADKFTAFRTAYFPDEQTTYASAELWLADAMDNPSAGLPATVAEQILEDDRSRILADSARATNALLAAFANRRYPLPPGAAAAALLEVEQKAQAEIAASSRKLTGLAIDNMRFAVDKVLSLRQSAMAATLDYVKTVAVGMDLATKVVDGGYGAQSRLISAAASFFGARTSARELEYKGAQTSAQFAQDAAKTNLQSTLTTTEMRLKSLITEAETLGRLAQSLFNNLNAQASSSAGFSETQNTTP